MATAEMTTHRPATIRNKKSGIGPGRVIAVVVSLAAVVSCAIWFSGTSEALGLSQPKSLLKTVRVTEGDIQVVVTESGTLESAKNATVKCQVEALVGQVGGQQGNAKAGGGGNRGGSGGGGGGAQISSGSGKSLGGAKGGTASKSGSESASMGGGTVSLRPVIQSFSMMVQPHQPLRGATSTGGAATKKAGQGGMGGGANRGGGGMMMPTEKTGSTRVLKLVPEGSHVKKGDIVCELDSAAFRDELQAQLIRWEQAKSWVDQAREILRVSQISLLEYRDGIYLQDLQQTDKYIEICETQIKQSLENLKWSREMGGKGLISPSQLRAAEYSEEQVRIALEQAKGMRKRLVNYSSPKLIANLEAKIAAVKSDMLAQQAAFQLEDDRKRRIEKMIELCTLTAPGDGMVAYARDNSGMPWAPTVTPMQEGVTVRQGQAILMLPDPNHMMVRVRVNESKISQVYPGQKAAILIEAFADHPLTGVVTEVTAIPALANGPDSGVKLYYANVMIDKGFEGLRTGLSAQVAFFVAGKEKVTRVPIQSVRWAAGSPFAAVPKSGQSDGFEWRALELGLMSTSDAEVLSGLKAGESVIANPDVLPAPPAALLRTQIGAAPIDVTRG